MTILRRFVQPASRLRQFSYAGIVIGPLWACSDGSMRGAASTGDLAIHPASAPGGAGTSSSSTGDVGAAVGEAAPSDGTQESTPQPIGLAGNTGGPATGEAGNAGGVDVPGSPRDYPCDYGVVPAGTPPVAWNDSPTLTPIGIDPYGKAQTSVPVGYILLNEGTNGLTQVPEATQRTILQRINDDFKFVTAYTYTHLPPWATSATAPHYIDYFFVATGLPKDPNAGGDSSWEGQYPDVETTSVAMTDASQRYDLTHEFFHVFENSYGTMPGQKVSWVQESYNDYLILRVAEHSNGATPGQDAQFQLPPNVGYLDKLVYQQPYVPIESCGINKSSAAVNGPGEYFTDTTGFRYNDLFPLFISQRVGQYFYAAVWEQAKTTEQNLQTMVRLLDKPRVQCLVQEYAARLALGDFLEFSTSIQRIADPGMYTATTAAGGTLTPTDATKLPRYTGRNNIPISVAPGSTSVDVAFTPDAVGSKGTAAELHAQIVYRATDGSVVFGPAVASGTASISLTKPPKNGTVIVVISNVTLDGYKTAQAYGWDPNETFGYKLQVSGGTPAATTKTYF